jgi:phosphomannomutase
LTIRVAVLNLDVQTIDHIVVVVDLLCQSVVTLDGYKFYLKDGSWVLIRSSGTEPIFRLYAEAESQHASDQLVEATRKFVETR